MLTLNKIVYTCTRIYYFIYRYNLVSNLEEKLMTLMKKQLYFDHWSIIHVFFKTNLKRLRCGDRSCVDEPFSRYIYSFYCDASLEEFRCIFPPGT